MLLIVHAKFPCHAEPTVQSATLILNLLKTTVTANALRIDEAHRILTGMLSVRGVVNGPMGGPTTPPISISPSSSRPMFPDTGIVRTSAAATHTVRLTLTVMVSGCALLSTSSTWPPPRDADTCVGALLAKVKSDGMNAEGG